VDDWGWAIKESSLGQRGGAGSETTAVGLSGRSGNINSGAVDQGNRGQLWDEKASFGTKRILDAFADSTNQRWTLPGIPHDRTKQSQLPTLNSQEGSNLPSFMYFKFVRRALGDNQVNYPLAHFNRSHLL
jgi:hypothetical protein